MSHVFQQIKLAVVFLLLLIPSAEACTAFSFNGADGRKYLAKNFDWPEGNVAIWQNPVGASHGSITKWNSKFGSTTIHLLSHGLSVPLGGINQAGLTLEVLMCLQTQLPEGEGKPQVDELEWLQYQLDNYSTIDQIEKNIGQFKIKRAHGPVHYYGCDKSECFVIEFEKGQPKIYRKGSLPFEALSNSLYDRSETHMQDPIHVANGPQDRFNKAAQAAGKTVKTSTIEYAAKNLAEFTVPQTKWNIIYDTKLSNLYFKLKDDAKFRMFHAGDLGSSTAKMVYERGPAADCIKSNLEINLAH